MTDSPRHDLTHEIDVDAPPERVFDLIRAVDAWPQIFPPTVHVEHLARGETDELLRIWATANGAVKSWVSRRELDRAALRVRFRQEVSQHPVASMGGEWVVRPGPDGGSRVTLRHDFRAVGDDPEHVDWINRAVDHNSTAELGALRTAAELRDHRAELAFTFTDTVRVASGAREMYEFIDAADRWPELIAHVARVELTEPMPGVQRMAMDTTIADGSTHTTESIRVCRPFTTIAYKQLRTPALMSVHAGRWDFTPDAGGAVVTSTHSVVLIPEAVPRVLGAGATFQDARDFVGQALSRNSTATIRHADEYGRGRLGARVADAVPGSE